MNDSEKVEKIKKAIHIRENDNEYPPICLWCEIRMTQHNVKDDYGDDYYEVWCDGCNNGNWNTNFFNFVKEVIEK